MFRTVSVAVGIPSTSIHLWQVFVIVWGPLKLRARIKTRGLHPTTPPEKLTLYISVKRKTDMPLQRVESDALEAES